jgi:hypothetical protein
MLSTGCMSLQPVTFCNAASAAAKAAVTVLMSLSQMPRLRKRNFPLHDLQCRVFEPLDLKQAPRLPELEMTSELTNFAVVLCGSAPLREAITLKTKLWDGQRE